MFFFFFSSRRRHTRSLRDWSSDVCSSDLVEHRDAKELDQLSGGGRHQGACARIRATDRKSTRLNSSHVEISYAVFCLKKKKHKDSDKKSNSHLEGQRRASRGARQPAAPDA